MTTTELFTGVTWLWLVTLHSFLMGLVFFAWTRVERLAPGRSRRWLLVMILVFPIVTATIALLRRTNVPESAWFDSSRVLNLVLLGGIEVGHLVIVIGVATLIATLFQEVIPVFFPPTRSDHSVPEALEDAARAQKGWESVEVIMIDDHLAAATGGTPWRPKLYLSATLAESFDRDQIGAIVRHEHAHLEPLRWWTVQLLFVARIVQAVNPVAMWVSREYSVETEIACDRKAVGDDPRTLARVLFAIYEEIGRHDPVRRRVLQRRIDILMGRTSVPHRVAQLPTASLLLAGALMVSLLTWVI